jgi:hypothetical protein
MRELNNAFDQLPVVPDPAIQAAGRSGDVQKNPTE